MPKTKEELVTMLNTALSLSEQIKEEKFSLEQYNKFMKSFGEFNNAFAEAPNTDFSLDQHRQVSLLYRLNLQIQYIYWNNPDINVVDRLEYPEDQADVFAYYAGMAAKNLDEAEAEKVYLLRDKLILLRLRAVYEPKSFIESLTKMEGFTVPAAYFKSKNTNNPANIFASHGSDKFLELLLKTVSAEKRLQFCRKPDIKGAYEGYTPLSLATIFGHVNCQSLLLDNGADPHAVITKNDHPAVGYIPIMFMLKNYSHVLKQKEIVPGEIEDYQAAILKLLQPRMQSSPAPIESLKLMQTFLADLPAPRDAAQEDVYTKLQSYVVGSKRPREEEGETNSETKTELPPTKRLKTSDSTSSTEEKMSDESTPSNASDESSSLAKDNNKSLAEQAGTSSTEEKMSDDSTTPNASDESNNKSSVESLFMLAVQAGTKAKQKKPDNPYAREYVRPMKRY